MKNKIFLIAEAGVNHNGDPELAKKLIEAASRAGADAVKFQAFRSERLVTRRDLSQLEMLRRLELSPEIFPVLKGHAEKCGILFLATPFDRESVDLLEPLVPLYKISSGDCTNLPFLRYIAGKGKPVILSTGMTTLDEVGEAVAVLKVVPVTLLHCTTNYPCPFDEVNLRGMLTLKKRFDLPVGYSDHTLGIEVPIAAAALGAEVIEKHFTLDRRMPGPDHQASLEPHELGELVRSIRNIERSLGDGIKKPQLSEIETVKAARRSLVFAQNLAAGSTIKEEHLEFKRPGTGLAPEKMNEILGRKLIRNVQKDDLVTLEVLG